MRTRSMLVVAAVLALMLMPACASVPQGGLNVTPVTNRDSQYAVWYHEVEQCSGKKGDFQSVTFYVTTDHLHLGHTFDGYWEPGSIVLRRPWEEESAKHEMMHDVLKTTQHPREYFNGKCGDLTRGEAI
jgi:hypothetical protein